MPVFLTLRENASLNLLQTWHRGSLLGPLLPHIGERCVKIFLSPQIQDGGRNVNFRILQFLLHQWNPWDALYLSYSHKKINLIYNESARPESLKHDFWPRFWALFSAV